MRDFLVQTKLLLPQPRSRIVERPRLDDLLRRGANVRLTLVSAPAGFGKTTLVGAWAAAATPGRLTAWVSLDERDQDATSFWTYLLLAIDRAAPGTASAALAQLESAEAPIEAVLATLLNELSVLPDDLTLVLDDYHLAETPDVQPAMALFVDRLPPQVHLVISTRADPALPLARLRARGDLVEIRAANLRFTGDESASYLNDLNTLGLAPHDVDALEARTEGWAAALQLAALSLHGRDDPSRFIAGFAGDDRFVVDYLADEVLDRQPAPLRQFLLDTSILERLTGPLCDAVTGRTDGRATLEFLERRNLFVVPLDEHRRWYRYHHLFADLLQARLLDERPDDVRELHRRASDWYDHADEPEAAVRHAVAAGDVELAADRAELAIPAMLRDRREDVIRRWSEELPADIASNRPVLAVGFVAGLMSSNNFDGIEQRLGDVRRMLTGPPEDVVVLDDAEFRRLPAAVETYSAAFALVSGDLPGTVRHAEAALARSTDDDHLTVASASALLGLASWTDGDLDAAHRAYQVAATNLRGAGHVADVLGCSITLADTAMTLGRLGDAQRIFQDALDLAVREPIRPRGVADMKVGLSRVALERGDLAGAAEYLRQADELGQTAGLPQNPYRFRVAMAQLRDAEGSTEAALALLEDAERVYVGDFSPNVRPIPAIRARVLAADGKVTAAWEWVRRRGLSAGDDLSYLREYEHVTLARVLLADHAVSARTGSLADTTGLLGRLLEAAEAGGRTGTAIEVLVLDGLARQAAGEQRRAVASIERAVRLAEPEGLVRVFTDVGSHFRPPLARLLSALPDPGPASYVRQLLPVAAPERPHPEPRRGTPEPQPLIDPLSSRELDVLRFLRSDLDGPDIARKLGVSLATVRTHTQHIYTKLGVSNRRAAVRRAHQLDLFSPTSKG